MATFYIADTHFGHKNILHYDNRPFYTVEGMNNQLADNWQMRVTPNDTVYILGDFCWGSQREREKHLIRLSGQKVLIRGNHDPRKLDDSVMRHFVDVLDYAEIEDAGRNVVLCHYPIPCFKNQFKGWYHLYGHVHVSFEAEMMEHDKFLIRDLYEKQCQMYNVGCMMPYMGYTPRTLDEIIAGAKEGFQHGKV